MRLLYYDLFYMNNMCISSSVIFHICIYYKNSTVTKKYLSNINQIHFYNIIFYIFHDVSENNFNISCEKKNQFY